MICIGMMTDRVLLTPRMPMAARSRSLYPSFTDSVRPIGSLTLESSCQPVEKDRPMSSSFGTLVSVNKLRRAELKWPPEVFRWKMMTMV